MLNLATVVPAFDPSTTKVEEGSDIQGHLWVHSEFKASPGYVRLHLKLTKKKGRKKRRKGEGKWATF